MSRLWNYVVDAVRSPREQLSRGQHFVRHSWDLAVHCYRQLRRHRADGMAAELTYRTIFALIPVVVLGLVMFRVVGGVESVSSNVEDQLYSFFGVPDTPTGYTRVASVETPREAEDSQADDQQGVELTPATGTPGSADSNAENGPNPDAVDDSSEIAEQQAEAAAAKEAGASIRRTLREVTAKVASVDVKSIGVLGLLLFLYTAVALAISAEKISNRIYDAPSSRPIHLRLAIHWSIITLGSGLLAMSLYMSGQVVEWFVEIGAGADSRLILSHLFSIAASWVLLFLLYALMPNTHVSVRAAAIGSLVGSLLWELAKIGFQIYVTTAVPYSAIYGSIGLLPLFLFWVYVTWLIILFGLILTYTLQSLGGNWPERFTRNEEALLAGDPDWMLPIMSEVAFSFESGEPIDNQQLGDRLGMPSRVVHEMTTKLVEANLLCRVSKGVGEEGALTLARPAEKIEIQEILQLAHRVGPTSDHPAWKTLANLKEAEWQAANGKTLADVNGR
ncbi:MAG: YhjD/YihY/BrkB family envelope integrity protein [Rubripirellula sp.]